MFNFIKEFFNNTFNKEEKIDEEFHSLLEKVMFEDIKEELVKARNKFPDNSVQNTALVEEVGELSQALLDHKFNNVSVTNLDVYREAVQVAAMAIRVGVDGDSSFDYDPNKIITGE